MERAVDERRLEVDDRIARDGSLLGDVPDTLLHAREELAGHDAAHDVLGEHDAATRVGLQLQPHVPELAAPTGLLLVTTLDPGVAPDGLPIGDPRRTGDDGGAELALETLGGDRDLVLALRPQELLAGLGLALDPHRGVLLQQPGEAGAQLVDVDLGRRLDGDREGRIRELDPRQAQRTLPAGQRVAGEGV